MPVAAWLAALAGDNASRLGSPAGDARAVLEPVAAAPSPCGYSVTRGIVVPPIGLQKGAALVAQQSAIGKSRMAREAAALAAGRGVEVLWAFCESHGRDISFAVVTRLLRAGLGVADLDGDAGHDEDTDDHLRCVDQPVGNPRASVREAEASSYRRGLRFTVSRR